jgi:hypothetical protein
MSVLLRLKPSDLSFNWRDFYCVAKISNTVITLDPRKGVSDDGCFPVSEQIQVLEHGSAEQTLCS